MKDFEYASPRTEAGLLSVLAPESGQTEVIAGGTDLVGLMKKMIVTPDRVVNLMEIDSMHGIAAGSEGLTIGAVTSLEDVLDHPALAEFPAVTQVIAGLGSHQLQAQRTLGGELCQRPRCWYFRGGEGLLADGGRLVAQGDNRYHAILGNTGRAKFVSPSRLAPALIALGAQVRIIGPGEEDETVMPVEFLYRAPRDEGQREITLEPGQVISHVLLPPADGRQSATYEVRQTAGPDYPLASATAVLRTRGGIVEGADIVLGQVAPTPWVAGDAARSLVGKKVNRDSAEAAGEIALSRATPLSENGYKVQLARVAVQRAILLAAGLETGGF